MEKPPSGPPQSPDTASYNVAAQAIQQILANTTGRPANAEQNTLVNRVIDAWRRRHSRADPNPILTLIAGYAGSGKTEFARLLSDITGWALLDKDALTRPLVERLLISLGGDPHDRHTDLYLREVRPLEYHCMMETAFDNLNAGTSAVLSAPFVAELADTEWVARLTKRCADKGAEVAVVWVLCDAESIRKHIEIRCDARDAWKLQNWEAYVSTLNTAAGPPAAHITIDNRLGAAFDLAKQASETLLRSRQAAEGVR
ncbi:AAA family ATPase [Nonomuraea aridisoli]|uniref:AAA family ATPase n=1 Tax=Nonomuraea aridisoli TaxID=2070368 RepID=UPI001F256234|nr:AAA family ATPase [Nonomuraea aridisoli]